jgi:hypothetical protein
MKPNKNYQRSQALVAHAKPSYSWGRDQEDCGLKPAQANSSRDPTSKSPSEKRAGGIAQDVDLEFNPQYHKIKSSVKGGGGLKRNSINGVN